MDPLTLSMAIVKALAIVLRVGLDLDSLVGGYQNAPQSLRAATFLVKEMGLVLSSAQSLLNNLVALHPSRKSMIEIDHLIIVVTQTTITFLDFEEAVRPFKLAKAGASWNWTKLRVEWLRKESNIQKIMSMLTQHKSSLSMIMDILQCKSDQEANQSHQKLLLMMQTVLEQNEDMRDRLMRLEASGITNRASMKFFEDNDDDRDDNVTIRPGNTRKPADADARRISIFENVPAAFELVLGDSRVYRRVETNGREVSFRSSIALTHAWSMLSGLSLSEISTISVIALPLRESEIQRFHEVPDDTGNLPEVYGGLVEVNGRVDTDLSSLKALKPEVFDEPEAIARLGDSSHQPEVKSAAPHVQKGLMLLSLDETTELFRTKVADVRQTTEQARASDEEISNIVKPKLTVDLSYSKIARLSEAVVELIREDVERLALSHNYLWHIPYRFSECSSLRYLNITSNIFREIPRSVYLMPSLEILDISRNKLTKITPDIRRMTSLRVLSIMKNRIVDLPPQLCEMTELVVIAVAKNPLNSDLRKVVGADEAELAGRGLTQGERALALAITSKIKDFLRSPHVVPDPIDVEDPPGVSSDSSAGNLEPLSEVSGREARKRRNERKIADE